MSPDQALQAGDAFARAHLDVIAAAYGSEIAASYAKGMATQARDVVRSQEGERAACVWFFCLGQDAITQPEGA